MTGLDVLERCKGYERDMERLRTQAAFARDAVMRVTRSAQAIGHGGGADKLAAYTAKADAIERAMALRTRMSIVELDEAGRLAGLLEPTQGQAIRLLMVRGMTVRQTAAEMHMSEDGVRGLQRRARRALASMPAILPGEYDALAAQYADCRAEARGENR